MTSCRAQDPMTQHALHVCGLPKSHLRKFIPHHCTYEGRRWRDVKTSAQLWDDLYQMEPGSLKSETGE